MTLPLPKPVAPVSRRGRRIGRGPRLPKGLASFRERADAADELWSRIVRAQAARCQRCFMRPVHDAHHLVSRTYHQTRWLLDVGAALCRHCHQVVGRDGEENRILAIRLVGAERWDQLQVTKNCRAKVDPQLAYIMLRYEAKKLGIKLEER